MAVCDLSRRSDLDTPGKHIRETKIEMWIEPYSEYKAMEHPD